MPQEVRLFLGTVAPRPPASLGTGGQTQCRVVSGRICGVSGMGISGWVLVLSTDSGVTAKVDE